MCASTVYFFRRGSLLGRRVHVFTVSLAVFLDYKATQKLWERFCRDDDQKDDLWERAHIRNAHRVHRAIIRLEGLWVKAGQYLSTRADVLPEPYIDRLKLLQDSLPPRPLKEVYAIIEADLGQHPSLLFHSFDPEPLGTASIAQVHRAVLHSGQQVVVKVQHKGVGTRILQDLENLRTIVRWVAWAEPDYNFSFVVDEWAAEVPKELDFVVEAENTKEVARNLRVQDPFGIDTATNEKTAGPNSAPPSDDLSVRVAIPKVIQAARRVLVLEYMDGYRVSLPSPADSSSPSPPSAPSPLASSSSSSSLPWHQVVESITRAYAHQIFVDGFFNADPHPGNFLVSKNPPHDPILLDFGLTKRLSRHVKIALAKMLLSAADSDLSMLLSSFSEMGLRLNVDLPEESMAVVGFFFRQAAPASESRAQYAERSKKRKEEKERKEEEEKEKEKEGNGSGGKKAKSKPRNPVDAFPGEIVFFLRVLNLLRGLASGLGTRVDFLSVMRPFAERVLSSEHLMVEQKHEDVEDPDKGPSQEPDKGGSLPSALPSFIRPSPLLSPLEAKLRALVCQLAREGRIIGLQLCVFKDGKMVADIAAGFLGKYDPRPVHSDSLFPVFSATKGITAGLLHWLADRGLLELHAPVTSVWPSFGSLNGAAEEETEGEGPATNSDTGTQPAASTRTSSSSSTTTTTTTIAHILTHRTGLQNALSSELLSSPSLMTNWEEMVRRMGRAVPENPPGETEAYHYLSFGWLAGGVAEKAGKRRFQDLLHRAFTRPLGVQGEFYIGIPAGIESRLATLSVDRTERDSERGQQLSQDMAESAEAAAATAAAGTSSAATPPSSVRAAAPSLMPRRDGDGGDAPEPGTASAMAPAGAPSAPPSSSLASAASSLPLAFNALFIRRAVIPSANGHFSARALVRYYAALANGGKVVLPPLDTADSSSPPCGNSASDASSYSVSATPGRGSDRRDAGGDGVGGRGGGKGTGAAAGRPDCAAGKEVEEGQAHSSKDGSPGFRDWLRGLLTRRKDERTARAQVGEACPRSSLLDDEGGLLLAQEHGAEMQGSRIFHGADVVDAFQGIGSYKHLTAPGSVYGLGFVRYWPAGTVDRAALPLQNQHPEVQVLKKDQKGHQEGEVKQQVQQEEVEDRGKHRSNTAPEKQQEALSHGGAFGHAGFGGSLAFCDPCHDFAFAITLNKLSLDSRVTSSIVTLVCEELGVPIPAQFSTAGTSHDSWQTTGNGTERS